jgi:hypothetical protein
MKNGSTGARKQSRNISQQKLTIGLDLGDRNWQRFSETRGVLTLADTHWSQLNILFASAGALCSYENQGGSRNGDSLPYLWR